MFLLRQSFPLKGGLIRNISSKHQLETDDRSKGVSEMLQPDIYY